MAVPWRTLPSSTDQWYEAALILISLVQIVHIGLSCTLAWLVLRAGTDARTIGPTAVASLETRARGR
jgi:hypothetical protein